MFRRNLIALPASLLLASSLLLSACGFHLRGTGVDNVKFDELNLSARNSHGQTYKQVRDALRQDGVLITESASYQLQLLNEREDRKAVTYTGRSTAAEFELTSSLEYHIANNQGLVLLGPEILSIQRVFINDKDNIIGTDEEEQLLRREMRRDLVRQLMFRLSGISQSDLQQREQALEAPSL